MCANSQDYYSDGTCFWCGEKNVSEVERLGAMIESLVTELQKEVSVL